MVDLITGGADAVRHHALEFRIRIGGRGRVGGSDKGFRTAFREIEEILQIPHAVQAGAGEIDLIAAKSAKNE